MIQKIQTTIVGYDGKAITLFSAYDSESMILIVSAVVPYRRERVKDCLVITNDPKIDRDSLFTESDLKPAITAFFNLKGGVSLDGKSSRLVFSDKAAMCSPVSAIEKDGIDEGGVKYRINEGVTCSQIAVLATSNYCDTKAAAIEASLDMMADFANFGTVGDILTI